MSVLANRRSVMTLFSGPIDPHSHRIRFVLAEKGINYEIEEVTDLSNPPEDLPVLNPYNTLPTLVDRELSLYDPQVILEYLDERFPHPPLMPVDPVMRAKYRLTLFRLTKDWYEAAAELDAGSRSTRTKKELKESIIASNEIFAMLPWFMGEEFSMLDCTVTPILWRLKQYNIDLGKNCDAIEAYMEKVFDRESFRESLTEEEREMR